ncbi:DnaJ domain-containing protein [Winogradskyella vincentii]|uniref:J domain-containing protein n=1 Tax=Winogradskyella vincentii TaxID=2877122 RepID=A0ABS7Y3Q4_9FLAO|nr:DnaJ domain-containing protein [Winogradskyella vincentii]MCA0153477.1 J domain-containing protein [Winogradskyella vincentii]
MTNYYQLLKIDPKADLNDIKKAFRREVALYHPDNNKSPEAKTRFEQIVEAFDILSNPEKRKAYNEMLEFEATNKPVIIEQKEQYKDWQKEAKKKSKKWEDFGLEELLLLDIFVLNGDILGSIFSDNLIDGLTDDLDELLDLF